MSDPLPLAGQLVLDLSQGIAGPSCGMAMAEHGARVIKVEPPSGDWIRGLGAQPLPGGTAFSLYYNRGKESLTLDLKTQKGRAAALALAAKADLLIESGRPGVTEAMGLGFEAVRALNPSIIYLTISGFGLTGPRAPDPMVDTYAQAYTAMMSINRDVEGTPTRFGQPIIDAVTGLYATQAALAALFPTKAARQARRLDVSLVQSAAALMGPKILEWGISGGKPGALNAPAGIFRAADRYLALTLVREIDWTRICRALAKPEWIEDPRFATFADRDRNLAELRGLMTELFATADAETWCEKLVAEGVMAGAVNDFGHWLEDEQIKVMKAAPERPYDLAGDVTLPTPRTPSRQEFDAASPGPGADTAALAAEFGLDLD